MIWSIERFRVVNLAFFNKLIIKLLHGFGFLIMGLHIYDVLNCRKGISVVQENLFDMIQLEFKQIFGAAVV